MIKVMEKAFQISFERVGEELVNVVYSKELQRAGPRMDKYKTIISEG